MKVFELIAEDLTHLGGPMGSEYTTESSLGLFGDPEEAKKVAEKHFNPRGKGKSIVQASWKPNRFYPEKPVRGWIKEGNGWRTQDLAWIMYRIRERKIK